MTINPIDLPVLVETKGGQLYGMKVYGVLIREIDQPKEFGGIVKKISDDRFVEVDLLGIETPTGRYYVRGRIVTMVRGHIVEEAKRKPSGRLAIVMSEGSIRSGVKFGDKNFLYHFKWEKTDFNSWRIYHVKVQGMTKNDVPEFFKLVFDAYRNNWNYNYPVNFPSGYNDVCGERTFSGVGETPTPTPTAIQQQNPWGVAQAEIGATNTWGTGISMVSPETLQTPQGNLGVAKENDLQTLVENRVNSITEKISTRPRVVDRDKILEKPPELDNIEYNYENAKEKMERTIDRLYKQGHTSDHCDNSDILYCAEALRKSWRSRNGFMSGNNLFMTAVTDVLTEMDIKEERIRELFEVNQVGVLDFWTTAPLSGEDTFLEAKKGKSLEDTFYYNGIEIYVRLIELITGIRQGRLTTLYTICETESINFLANLKTNPYLLSLLEPKLSLEDLDKLSMLYGVDLSNEEILRDRNKAYVHSFMLDSENRIIGENTVIPYKDLVREVEVGYTLEKRTYDNLTTEGTILQKTRIEALRMYLNKDVKDTDFKLPLKGWRTRGKKYVLSMGQGGKQAVEDFVEGGLGVPIVIGEQPYISSIIFVKKELYIYEKLNKIFKYNSSEDVEITEERLDKCIRDFEKLKCRELGLEDGQFKLEKQQERAVRMIKEPIVCLTGGAGSGKTTTAEAVVYAIQSLLDVKDDEIFFVAPTGRASARLREVVKRKTSTIHSCFGIGGSSVSLRDGAYQEKTDISVLLVDETSMPNISLMYEMLMRVPTSARIYFIGDIDQLPPIGFGKPFQTMLQFLPTVVLNVPKRASNKSGITLNANRVSKESDGVLQELENKDDFRIVNERNPEAVAGHVETIVKYHLGKAPIQGTQPVNNLGDNLSPDDIQIITPVNRMSHWGTVDLNKRLHNVFNPRQHGQKVVMHNRGKDNKQEFRIGDRVMHTTANNRQQTRLDHHGGAKFTLSDTTGINNGDVGKIIGFYQVEELDFSGSKTLELEEELIKEFRGTKNTYFLGVKYKDINENTGESIEFVVLYRMDLILESGLEIEVSSRELNMLELAYASTTHKLQGSQARLIIVVMLPVGRGDYSARFISRNMIYTAISRGQEAGYLVGDVYGTNSCINRGRKVEQTEQRKTIFCGLFK